MNNKRTHAILMALVGAYIIYIAYSLMEKALSGANEMPMPAAIAFSAVFVSGGIGAIVYALKIWKQAMREEESQKDEVNDIK